MKDDNTPCKQVPLDKIVLIGMYQSMFKWVIYSDISCKCLLCNAFSLD